MAHAVGASAQRFCVFEQAQSSGGARILAVTTTDLLKVIGVAAFLLDHYGLYFDPDQEWWRVFGRLAVPIFFAARYGVARYRATLGERVRQSKFYKAVTASQVYNWYRLFRPN